MKKLSVLLFSIFFSGFVLASDFTLYFVRHFEKQKGPDPELTEQGRKRAEQLANLLDNTGLTKVYSSDYKRTKQSGTPIAERLGLDINLYDPRRLDDLATRLLEAQETALIVGHSNTTPAIVNLVGGKAEPLSESDYGDVFIVKFATKEEGNTDVTLKGHLKVTLND